MNASVGLRRVYGAVRVSQELKAGFPNRSIRRHKERGGVLPTVGSRQSDLGIRAHLRERGCTRTRAPDRGLRMTGATRVGIEGRSQAVGNALRMHKTHRRVVKESQLVWAKIRDWTAGANRGSPRPGIDRWILVVPPVMPVIPVPILPERRTR